ncbi:MAG: hypothetical protein J3Q66DRAFT_422153 [Benniella sp.]|nr:MAG: hypothetical protein J3Q66DRAFT_422153 [Benniella sp.]
MLFGNIISSPRDVLTPTQALELANAYLEHASKAKDPYIALILCHDTEVSLSQAARGSKRFEVQGVHEGIATTYVSLGKLLDNRGRRSEAHACYKKAEKLSERLQREQSKARHRDGSQEDCQCHCHEFLRREDSQDDGHVHVQEPNQEPDHSSQSQLVQYSDSNQQIQTLSDSLTNDKKPSPVSEAIQKQDDDMTKISQAIFAKNIRPPAAETIEKDTDEQDRLKGLATSVIRAFQREEIKDNKVVAEVVCLAPVLEQSEFQYLLRELCKSIDQSILLDVYQLDGVAQLIQCAEPEYLDADDLVKILELLSTRLWNTHNQSSNRMYQLTMAVSRVLDAMADTKVKGLDREKLHEPLSLYLSEIKDISDPYLVYQAAYAYQALLYVPDDETLWQATLRRTGKVIQGAAGLVSAVKGLDLNGFMEGLKDIQQGMSGATGVFKLAKSTVDGVTSLSNSGKGFVEGMKEGLGVKRKLTWYPALRGAELLLRSGQLSNFKKLVFEVPCRLDPVSQWGVCQLLGEVAVDSMWDAKARQSAVMFLGEIYSDRTVWESHANVQEWILVILMKLASSSGDIMQEEAASSMIRDLESRADTEGQAFIQACRQKDHAMYPLRIAASTTASPSLIDRAQNRPDVEGHLRQLRKQHLKEQGIAVYIPPQAKAGLQASDESRFQLMDKVKEFLNNEQKVFLLLGDPGAGKSTFSRALDRELWNDYKKDDDIPLHINLPAIDKPEHDMIAKQLRKMELTEPQIRELKLHRRFILICDGYDESQQTHNLYISNRLNEPGEWIAKMIISCRTEYLGMDYRDRF